MDDKWIPPKDGSRVLMWCNEDTPKWRTGYWDTYFKCWRADGITSWRPKVLKFYPLPPAPHIPD